MKQAEKSAKRADKMPVVIFCFDWQKSVVALPTYVLGRLFTFYKHDWRHNHNEPFFTSFHNFCGLAREQM
jgi:hypothetical protein